MSFKLLKGYNESWGMSLLDNEQIIHYWNNNGDVLISRVIAWRNWDHYGDRWGMNRWVERTFQGTMVGFFYDRLDIPLIFSIETGDRRYSNDLLDREQFEYINNFQPYQFVTIKWFEYVI